MIPKPARLIPVGKAPGAHSVPQDRINEILAELAGAGLTVARLKGGDPMIFGRGGEEAAYLAARGIAVEFAPGITAAQGAAASLGMPLTQRGLATGVRYVTGHRQAGRGLDLDWKRLADPDTTLVVYMGAANIGRIAMRLIAEGMPAGLPVMAVANTTTPQEERLLSRLDRIAVDLRGWAFDGPVLFFIGHVVSQYAEAGQALPETAHLLEESAALA